jgi:hypothetical protein
MEREFSYNDISIADVDANTHLAFVCDADAGKVTVISND